MYIYTLCRNRNDYDINILHTYVYTTHTTSMNLSGSSFVCPPSQPSPHKETQEHIGHICNIHVHTYIMHSVSMDFAGSSFVCLHATVMTTHKETQNHVWHTCNTHVHIYTIHTVSMDLAGSGFVCPHATAIAAQSACTAPMSLIISSAIASKRGNTSSCTSPV